MPYHLSTDGLSVLDDQNKVVKKHPSKAKAKAHLMALNMNVKEARMFEVGARNSAPDMKRIQEIHDAACQLGAECQAAGRGPMMQEAVSYSFIREQVEDAVRKQITAPLDGWLYIEELFDEYAIIEMGPPEVYWKIPYTLSGEIVTLSPRTEWQQVVEQTNWIPVATEARKILRQWATKNTSKQK